MKNITLDAGQLATVDEVASIVHDRYATEVHSRFGQDHGVPALRLIGGGVAAEVAVSIALGETWHRGDELANVMSRRADVGEINEVRWTAQRPPTLRVYDPDSPTSQDRGHVDRRFWLVTGWPPRMAIHGWVLGRDVVRDGTRRQNPEGFVSYHLPADAIPPWPSETLIGVALGQPRSCPSCHDWHPAGTTCAAGWAPA